MTAYYNEFDPYAAQWLRNLIKAGHIAPGVVDERSIEDVKPDELMGYTQCHFFAGVGVWSYALRQAGWTDDKPVWTGSCPCQPFSTAGKGAGFNDERHLWPAWQWLIQQCRPPVIYGEQVASKAVEPWVDLVHADVEAMGYAYGCVPFPSAGIGSPQIRDRNFWVANATGNRRRGQGASRKAEKGREPKSGFSGQLPNGSEGRRFVGGLGNAGCEGLQISKRINRIPGEPLSSLPGQTFERTSAFNRTGGAAGPVNGFWEAADWLFCRDGKWRPVEPGTFPLADGLTNRVGRLRAYGNAINAEAAKEFIRCSIELFEG